MVPVARSLLAGFLFCLAFVARAADPVAFLSDIKGDVVMNGGGRPPFLAELLPGTKLSLGQERARGGDVCRERRGVRPQGSRRIRRHPGGREGLQGGCAH